MIATSKRDHGWDAQIVLPPTVTRIYDLAHPLRTGIPHHPNHPPFCFSLTKLHGEAVDETGVSAASELIVTGGHVGTHIDALCHVSRDGKVYGGNLVAASQSYAGGIEIHPIHELQPLFGGGHLVDLPGLLGRETTPHDRVGADEFDRWFQQHVAPGPGSIVLIRTGWSRYWSDNRSYVGLHTGCPGVVVSGARWLTDRGIAATGSDTIAYEQTPDPALSVHVHLLVENGVPIMEALDLERLAADQIWEFLFIAIPLPIANGTGSPIRPLALV